MPKNAKISELTNSRTQVLDYLNCGYRWELGYKRGIASTKLHEKMDMGSAVHMAVKYAIQHYAVRKVYAGFTDVQTGLDAWARETRARLGDYLTDQHQEEIDAIRYDAVGIALKALESINLPTWEVASWKGQPLCEVEVMTPLPPWKGFRTIPDLVARRKSDGKKAPYWLIDWKTRSSFGDDDSEEINLQFATMQYVLAREIPEVKIGGSLLWQIRGVAPKKPELIKSGAMSRAAIVTDWKTYEAALMEAKLNPADYTDMKEKIGLVEWFRILKQHRSATECRQVWEKIVVPASREMASPNPRTIRRWVHQPFACQGCWARDFCMAEMRDEDTDFLLETDYMDTRNPRQTRDLGDKRRSFTLT